MTFKEAYRIASDSSDYFRKFDSRVKERKAHGEDSGVLLFCIDEDPSQVFAYGFDGVDDVKYHHTPKRGLYLINTRQVYHI